MINQERVICLSKVKYGEADLILKFISTDGSVYSAIAKSALRSRKRFGGGILEPTHHLAVTVKRRSSELTSGNERLPVLEEATLLDDFAKIKTDYDRLDMALQFVRTVGLAAREGDSNKEIFNLLGHSLRAVETTRELGFLRLQFQLKFLHLQGVLPPDERTQSIVRVPIRDHERLEAEITTQLIGLMDWRELAIETSQRLDAYIG